MNAKRPTLLTLTLVFALLICGAAAAEDTTTDDGRVYAESNGQNTNYVTYLGGTDSDWAGDVEVDSEGNIYVTGYTYSTNFPTTSDAYQSSNAGEADVFLAKYNSNGELVYSTYFGGSGEDWGLGIALDSAGYIYITGMTFTFFDDFPVTSNAYQTSSLGGTDSFLSIFNSSGELVYSTYLGGSGFEFLIPINGIAVDSEGNAYITGKTESTDFPVTAGAFQTASAGEAEAFVIKFNSSREVVYSTYLGGPGGDSGFGIAADSSGCAYITGYAMDGFPITGGVYQTIYAGNVDAFVTKLNPTGTGLIYSTYLGGTILDEGIAIAVDSAGCAYITGDAMDGFPITTGAYQTTYVGDSEVFATKLNPDATSLVYSTYIGKTYTDKGYGIAVDSEGCACISGFTGNEDFPTTSDAYQSSANAGAFLTKLNPDGTDLAYSTKLTGNGLTEGYGITVDSSNNAYVTGRTSSTDFPVTSDAYQATNAGDYDAFVVRLILSAPTPETVTNVRSGQSYTSIQAAIDDVLTLDGDTITVQTGSYNENITVSKQLILNATGTATVNPVNTDLPVFTINSGGSGSIIQGFTISSATNSFGVYTASANNCQIIGNTISGNFMGIYIQNSNNNTASGNTIQNNSWLGICLDNSSSNTINSGNIITGNLEGVYMVNTSNGNTITSNNIYNNADTGITILNSSTGNYITNNTTISNNSVIGVNIRDSDNNTITGNTIANNGWAGITLDNADATTINGGNTITGNQEGLNLTNSTGNTITANNITNNTNIGISIINSSTGNNITGNATISNNGIIGVYLRDSGTNTISGNAVESNGWVGVCLDQSPGNTINGDNNISSNLEGLYIVNNSNNNTIQGNNIHNNTDTGIYIDSSTGNNITSNTTISSNGVIGILLRGANGNTIAGNTLQNNTWSGIALDNASTNTINGTNTISGSTMGAYVTNNSNSNTINNNALQNNTWAGLVLDQASNTTVYQNNFINNPLQALAQNGTGNTFYQETSGNHWNDWTTTNPRPIYGNENLYDQYPSTNPF